MQISLELMLSHPEDAKAIVTEAHRIVDTYGYLSDVMRLSKFNDWGEFSDAMLVAMANPIDSPFVKLMLSLGRKGYRLNAISFHRWWRRMKAVNQHHIITYFSYKLLDTAKKDIDWADVYAACFRTHETLAEYQASYGNDKSVEMNLRAMLGISQQTDIKKAWIAWAKENHPDKGGSVDRFVLVKAAYEEWSSL